MGKLCLRVADYRQYALFWYIDQPSDMIKDNSKRQGLQDYFLALDFSFLPFGAWVKLY